MRILFVTTHAYLPQRVGGSQLSTHDLCVELSARGHRAAVLCDLQLQLPLDWTRFRSRVLARLTRRPYPCDRWRPYQVYRGYGATEGVGAVTRAFCPDVAVVQSGTAVPVVEALLAQNVRTILYFRDVEFEGLGGSIPCDPRLRFVANSRFTACRVRRAFGVDPAVVQPLVRPAAYRTAVHGRHVLFVNPLAKKGLHTAIELARLNPDIPFVFLESWPMTAGVLEALAGLLRELSNVTFRRATLDMAREYAQARILLVPSVWEEAWGRVVTEAHCSGIPVIASAIGGLPESVGPGGILVPPGSPIGTWVEPLRAAWTSAARYAEYRRRACEHARREEIQPETLVRRLMEVMAGPW